MNLRLAYVLLAAITIARLVVAATTGIVEDEAYYFTWSEHLAAGYYDHPPGVAWAIALSARVLGATSLGVRGGPILLGALGVGALARRAKDPVLFVLLVGTIPLYTLGGVLATPDAPMLAGWALALAGALGDRWVLVGVGAGLAGLSKYTGWGLWPLLFLAAPGRWRVMIPGLLVTLLLLAPNLLWNAGHDWISVKFQAGHGLGGEGATSRSAPGPLGALELLGAQVGLAGPLLFGAAVAAWGVGRKSVLPGPLTGARLGWWTSLPVITFFSLAATLARSEPNWVAPAWLGVALALSEATGRLRRAAWMAVGVGGVLSALVVLHLYRPLVDVEGDPTARLGVGRDLAESVQAWGVEPVYTERYQEAALIHYYEGLETYALPGVARADQYDLWPVRWADHALFVRPTRGGDGMPSDRFCAGRGSRNVISERDGMGGVLATWQVAEVSDCGPAAP